MYKVELERHQVTGLVLAGGRGTRMGQIDKGLQLYGNTPLFEHAIRRLKPQVSTLLVNANSDAATYSMPGFPVIKDSIPGFQGPLAGFVTGLLHCRTPYLLTVPCDAPFFPLNLREKLAEKLVSENADLAVASTGEGTSYQLQPVFCLMKTTMLTRLEAFLKQSDRRLETWFKELDWVEVHFADDTAFFNVNTIESLEKLNAGQV